jgi:hypothetical protein
MKDNPYENELYKAFKKFLEDYFMGRVEFPQENQNDEVLMKLQKSSISKNNQKSSGNNSGNHTQKSS